MKSRKYFSLIIILLFLNPITIGKALAYNANQETYIVPNEQTIDDDLFITSQKVEIKGIVNGNVYVVANNIEISGTITGNLYSISQIFNCTGGNVSNSHNLAVSSNFNGCTVSATLTAISPELIIDDKSTIGHNLLFAGLQTQINGPVAKYVYGAGDQINLNSTINQDVFLAAPTIILGNNAVIKGNLTHAVTNNVKKEEKASVGGMIYEDTRFNANEKALGYGTGFSWYWFAASFLVGIIITILFPKTVQDLSATIMANPKRTLFWGLPTLFLTPFFLMIIMTTIVGIPLGIMGFGLYFFALFISPVIVGICLADYLLKPFKRKVGLPSKLLIGLLVYYLISVVPVANIFVWIITRSLGYGALFLKSKEYIAHNVDFIQRITTKKS